MAPERVQAARCIRCGLGIVITDGVDALEERGWVKVEGEQEETGEEGTKRLVRPMICPKCAGRAEGDPSQA